jgi:type I restriction enzyme, S subunit
MDLTTFFEKFDQLADAPDAVEKLRELVLELAVRGQLSERLPNDQDDPAWRAFIKEFDNRIYGSDPGPPPPFNVPDEWRWACLEDVGTTKVRNDVDNATSVSFVPMALIPATYGVPVQFEERNWGEIKKGFTHFADNDVVMAKITPCFENAKSAVMRNLINGVGAGTTELHVFRSTTKVILPDYVLLYIKTRGFISRGESRMTGSAGQKRVPREYFATSPFPLPPLAEQKRIVAKVDELMAMCDRLEAQQQERESRHAALARASLARFATAPTPANLNFLFHSSFSIPPSELRRSILTLAVQGKLVPQDPNDEPAEELLARLEQEKARIAKKQGVRSPKNVPPLAADIRPHEIPESWRWSRIGHLALVIDYGTSQKADSDSSQVPVYRMGNIVGGRLVDENLKYVDASIDDLPGLYLKTDDILFNRTNSYELVGKAGIYTGPNDTATFASYLIRIRLPSTLLFPTFFNLAMNAPYFRQTQIEPEIVQQCGQANFNGTKLASTVVPLPPLAEQRRIVAKVEQLMALVDKLEQQLAASRATADKLLTALVTELTAA